MSKNQTADNVRVFLNNNRFSEIFRPNNVNLNLNEFYFIGNSDMRPFNAEISGITINSANLLEDGIIPTTNYVLDGGL